MTLPTADCPSAPPTLPCQVGAEQLQQYVQQAPVPSGACCRAACVFNVELCSCEKPILELVIQFTGEDPAIYGTRTLSWHMVPPLASPAGRLPAPPAHPPPDPLPSCTRPVSMVARTSSNISVVPATRTSCTCLFAVAEGFAGACQYDLLYNTTCPAVSGAGPPPVTTCDAMLPAATPASGTRRRLLGGA
jgi:hypothetical protein